MVPLRRSLIEPVIPSLQPHLVLNWVAFTAYHSLHKYSRYMYRFHSQLQAPPLILFLLPALGHVNTYIRLQWYTVVRPFLVFLWTIWTIYTSPPVSRPVTGLLDLLLLPTAVYFEHPISPMAHRRSSRGMRSLFSSLPPFLLPSVQARYVYMRSLFLLFVHKRILEKQPGLTMCQFVFLLTRSSKIHLL